MAAYNSGNPIVDQFYNLFTNYVGRPPTDAEITQFSHDNTQGTGVWTPESGLRAVTDPTQIRNALTGYITDTFQQQANQTAQDKLAAQTSQWNDLANQYETQGTSAINDTQQALLDYQSKLFDRLRPNLLTSLKAQGLLDTGGLNEAVAGVQGDLANNASQYIAQLQLQNKQNANSIRFGGASAPLSYAQALATNQPQAFSSNGAGALNFNNNTFMSNLDYQHQLGLQNNAARIWADQQPSMLSKIGSSFANSFGQNSGQFAAQDGQSLLMLGAHKLS